MIWQQLTIYVAESDFWQDQPLYVALVEQARKRGLAGATAMRVMGGYTRETIVETTHFLDLSSHLPIVVTIVDREEAIATFLPLVKEMVQTGLVTLHPIQVLHPIYE